jgi:hypothetical protein
VPVVLLQALKDAFEKIVNSRDNKPAELIAKFLDAKLRGSGKSELSDSELESRLDQALVLFRFIQVAPPSLLVRVGQPFSKRWHMHTRNGCSRRPFCNCTQDRFAATFSPDVTHVSRHIC